MSKVLVDRELLERIASDDEGAASFADFEEIKHILAQPTEAKDFAHELWSVAQLAPGEGITDGVARIAALLAHLTEAEGVQTWRERIVAARPKSEPGYWPDALLVEHMLPEIEELSAALSAVTAERDGLAAARMAYANEFAPDENGDPDVGNVHANIRALKAERDRLRSKWARVESERDRLLSDNASLRGSCKALGEENKQLKHENKRQGRTIAAMAAKEA